MKAISFRLQDVINPETGVESQRIAVAFDNGKVLRLLNGDKTIEETKAQILEDRAKHLSMVVVVDTEFNTCCRFSNAITVEEF